MSVRDDQDQEDGGAAVRPRLQERTNRSALKKNRPEFPDRDLAILKDRLYRCRTYSELADEHGITAERVRQILNRSVRLVSHSEQTIAGLKSRVEQLVRELRIRDRLHPPNPVALSWERLLDQNVEELHLTPRACHAMERYEISTIAELWDKPDSELLGWLNFGRKSLRELREEMIDYCARHGWTVIWKRTQDSRLGYMELEPSQVAVGM